MLQLHSQYETLELLFYCFISKSVWNYFFTVSSVKCSELLFCFLQITQLHGDMERVKIDQNKLEQELEFIGSQQRELEELLVPLEKKLEQMPSSSLQPHADLERENT